MQLAGVKVDVTPLQPEQLAEPQTGGERRLEQRCVVVARLRLLRETRGRSYQRVDLVVVPDVVGLALAAGAAGRRG